MKRQPYQSPLAGRDDWTLEDIERCILDERGKSFNRAQKKIFGFVNECVTDPDFKRSPALLKLLLILRDELADGATEGWTVDDYLEPVVQQLTEVARNARQERFSRIKDEIIELWLSEPRKHGERERFSDEIAKRYCLSPNNIRKQYLSKSAIDDYKVRYQIED